MDYFPQHDDFHYNNFVSSSVTRVVKKETRIGVSMLRNRKDLIETHVKYFLCKHLCSCRETWRICGVLPIFNTYDEVTLTNGSQGMKRIDLVVNRYTRNDETGLEKNEWVVIIGTPDATNPKVPEYIAGNLQNGDLTDDCPVFEVHYDGINVTEVKKLLPVMSNLDLLNGKLEDAIIVKTYTKDNIFASANSYASVAVNAPVISGYNRVMWQTSIYNATTGGTHVTNCWITSATVTTGNDNMNVMITNSGGTQAKLKVIVKMLYVKTKA